MRLDPFTYYNDGERGDRVALVWTDGKRIEGRVDGMLLAGGEPRALHVTLSNGDRFRLREGDTVEILSSVPPIVARGARRSRRGF